MILISLSAALLLTAGQSGSPAVTARDIAPTSVIGQGTEAVPAGGLSGQGAGITLDRATRERPTEVVCREQARSTFSRIGPSRVCRSRIEWARREATSRNMMGRMQEEGASRLGMSQSGAAGGR